jgi:hypothetical protein
MAIPSWLTAWIDILDESADYYTVDGQHSQRVQVFDTSGDERVCAQAIRFRCDSGVWYHEESTDG